MLKERGNNTDEVIKDGYKIVECPIYRQINVLSRKAITVIRQNFPLPMSVKSSAEIKTHEFSILRFGTTVVIEKIKA
jgi:hypothetical protein